MSPWLIVERGVAGGGERGGGSAVGRGDAPGDRCDRGCGGAGSRDGGAGGAPGPGTAGPPIDFVRDEVAEICGALALGGSLLRRLGLGAEAARLEALFGAVEERLAESQRAGLVLPGIGLVGQRERVDAVAQPGVGGAVGEHVAQVAAAAGAQDLGPRHAEAAVGPLDDGAGGAGPVEARPARPRLEFGIGVEQFGTATGAAEHAVAVDVEQVTGPGRLGAGPPQHGVAVGRQLVPPLLVGPGDLVLRLVVLGLAGEHGRPLAQAARPAAAVPMRKRKLSV